MGRKAGVTAEQTRAALLRAAARVFALKGYDGASIADITSEAGLSSGSIYAHYEGKAELFVDVVREHAQAEFASLIGIDRSAELPDVASMGLGVADFVERVGTSYGDGGPRDSSLLIEAIVAAKRHPEVAALVTSWLGENERFLDAALGEAQRAGIISADIGVAEVGRFLTMVALGARLTSALGMPKVDPQEWSRLIEHLVGAVRGASRSEGEHQG